MDHIPSPSNTSPGSAPEVPCICENDGYTGRFLDYPAHKGWSYDELFCRRAWDDTYECDDPDCTVHRCACNRTHSVKDNAAFLQNWLFFGLARALFDDFVNRVHVVPRSRFLRVNDSGQTVLSTTSIRDLGARWCEINTDLTSDEFMGEPHFKDILTQAHAVFMFVSRSTTIDPMLLLPIGLLGEFLVSVVERDDPFALNDQEEWKSPELGNNAVSRHIAFQMQVAGWCPSDVNKLNWFDLSGLWFIKTMGNPRAAGDHDHCDKHRCTLLYTVSEADYVTGHTQPACSCSHIAADQSRLASLLERGVVPLISITTQPGDSKHGSSVQVEVVESSDESNYVAFSHVWADGLGNPRQNSLPRCQVRRLGELAAQLHAIGDDNDEDTKPVLIWIDTLACPVTPLEARNRALRLMGETYRRADKVLVLDSALTVNDVQGMCRMEQAIRIYLSNWTRRLWTLQEGVFARRLYVQFADRSVDFDELKGQLNRDYFLAREPGHHLMLSHYCDQIRGTERRTVLGGPSPYSSLVHFGNSLHSRSCTKIVDEPVCLGTLLDLDVAPVLQGLPEQRMKAFWSILPRLNRKIIFWTGPCLDDDGFRWAPSTLINETHQLPLPDPGDDEVTASPRTEGLEVRFPGILLGRASQRQLPGHFWLRDRGTNTCPFHIVAPYVRPVPPDHLSLALILKRGVELRAPRPQSDTVLLVSIHEDRDGVLFATLLTQGILRSDYDLANEGIRPLAMEARGNLMRDIIETAAITAMLQCISGEHDDVVRAFSHALETSDASHFQRDGMHQGFELDMLPPDTLWCVQRDPAWQLPIMDDESQEEVWELWRAVRA